MKSQKERINPRDSELFKGNNRWLTETNKIIALGYESDKWRRQLSKTYSIVKEDRHWLSLNHEAAHAVIALAAELRIHGVSVDTESFIYGGGTLQGFSGGDQILMGYESAAKLITLKTIMMAMAGPVYENLISPDFDPLHHEEPATEDFEFWRQGMKNCFPKFSKHQLIAIELKIMDFVQHLLLHENIQMMLRSLVVALLKQKNLTLGEEEMEKYRRKHLSTIWDMHGAYLFPFSRTFIEQMPRVKSPSRKSQIRKK